MRVGVGKVLEGGGVGSQILAEPSLGSIWGHMASRASAAVSASAANSSAPRSGWEARSS